MCWVEFQSRHATRTNTKEQQGETDEPKCWRAQAFDRAERRTRAVRRRGAVWRTVVAYRTGKLRGRGRTLSAVRTARTATSHLTQTWLIAVETRRALDGH